MSGPIKPSPTTYSVELEAYNLRLAVWLGLDPHEVGNLRKTKKPVNADGAAIAAPPDLEVTWASYDKEARAEEHDGRHQLPVAVRGTYGEPTVFTNTVVLAWYEVERLRAEVGEKPEFPAPVGGWPKGWATAGS